MLIIVALVKTAASEDLDLIVSLTEVIDGIMAADAKGYTVKTTANI